MGRLFLNFGIGNGKTLLCTSLAIILGLRAEKPVIILGKQEYLPYRDHKKFKEMIKECGL
jgi:preprotein translocase subunit SecA